MSLLVCLTRAQVGPQSVAHSMEEGSEMSLPGFTAEASVYGKHQISHMMENVGTLAGNFRVFPQNVTLKYSPWLVRWFRCAEKHSAWPIFAHPAKPGSCMYDCIYRTTYPPGCTTVDCYNCCDTALQNCYTTGQFIKGPCCALPYA
jgi:hypothetical protein